MTKPHVADTDRLAAIEARLRSRVWHPLNTDLRYLLDTVADLHSRLACVLEASYWDRPYDTRIDAIRGMCDLTTNGLTPASELRRAEADS